MNEKTDDLEDDDIPEVDLSGAVCRAGFSPPYVFHLYNGAQPSWFANNRMHRICFRSVR